MSIWVILKSLKNNCQAKKIFIVPWPVEKLATKNMNIFWMFGIILKWKQGKICKDEERLAFKMWLFIVRLCVWNKLEIIA